MSIVVLGSWNRVLGKDVQYYLWRGTQQYPGLNTMTWYLLEAIEDDSAQF